MTLEEYNQRMEALVKDLPQAHADLLIGLANTVTALIKRRIQTTGVDSKGNKFRSYSDWYQAYKTEKGKNKGFTDFSFTNRMWTNIQLIKQLATENMAVITAMDKGQKGGYETVYVKSYTRKAYEYKGKKYPERTIPAYDYEDYIPTNYEKLEKNTEIFGPILALSEQEIKDLAEDYDKGILQIFRDHGL